MDLQYSQTVCVLLDQRNTIFAPQFGQVPVGWVIELRSRTARLFQSIEICPPMFRQPERMAAPRFAPWLSLRERTPLDELRSPTRGAARNRKGSGKGIGTQEKYGPRGAIPPADIAR